MNSVQKKAIFLSVLIAFFVTLWKKDEHEYIKEKSEVAWIHAKKDDNGKLIQNFVSNNSIDEVIHDNIKNEGKQNRLPANNNKDQRLPDQKVVFINPNNPNTKPELNDLTFINSYNPQWKELLAKELMLFQPNNIEVYFKPLKSVVKILENNQAIFLEEVAVTYKTNYGPRSFKALINSQTGKVVETWGKTHYDNYSPRIPASENKGLSPSGTL